MFASLLHLIGGRANRKVRLLSNNNSLLPLKFSTPRRPSGWLSRRLPLLILWSLVVIFLLYKLINSTQQDNKETRATFSSNSDRSTTVQDTKFTKAQLLIRSRTNQDMSRLSEEINEQDTDSYTVKHTDPSVISTSDSYYAQSNPSSTTKSDKAHWYKKQSKVFILIIQKEQFPSPISKQHNKKSYNNTRTNRDSLSITPAHNILSHELIIPAHIRVVIEILEAHRIQYTIDSTRSGLPAQLLNDQDIGSEGKKYSVIIIDDFIRYTKLGRWIRDQLDRHCHKNLIGVVTFINHEKPSTLKTQNHSNSRRSVIDSINTKNSFVRDDYSRKPTSSTSDRESLTDQFPLIVKPIDQLNCSNLISSCLVDHQLSDKAPVLRILKRRPNFILKGLLPENLNLSPWMSMSSNHITYEPLTWAKLIKSVSSSSVPTNTVSKKSRNYPTKAITQERNHVTKRNTIQSHTSSQNLHNESRDQSNIKSNTKGRYNADQTNSIGQQINSQYPDLSVNSTSQHETSSFISEIEAFSSEDVIGVSGVENTKDFKSDSGERHVLSMFDRGLYDGIKRVIFGGAPIHWLNRVLLLDAIEHLSGGRILHSLDRYIQVDIDDIFVGESGKRLTIPDVDSMIETQKNLAKKIEGGFKFNLGFSGKYYERGNEEEKLGDQHLISNAAKFTWFCHTWSHSKAHLFNNTQEIVNELTKNLNFAKKHKLPIIGHKGIGDLDLATLPPTYAIAPHHSGVYPVHSQLYEAWRQVLNVQVTSTEEYPHLKPASQRRAFVHQTIKVLPRQTCGLYTHTIYKDKYPGGISKLDSLIKGGELFETILHNPVNIYMSHMTNYANDRLAQYTFNALLEFVQLNTNLQLKYASSSIWTNDDDSDQTKYSAFNTESTASSTTKGFSPTQTHRLAQQSNHDHHLLGPNKLADHYFSLFPEEKQPLWTNPCSDKRHMAIWAEEKKNEYCSVAPKLLIVGPQKTGTTALYSFLKINPLFKSSQISPIDYEEVQFFNDKHYYKGVDWYFSNFINNNNDTRAESPSVVAVSEEDPQPNNVEEIYYDKSATYFDDPQAALRASQLLPEAFIVILLVNPADRAYSWYQHIKAHSDPLANSVTFEQLITMEDIKNNKNLADNWKQDERSKGLQAFRRRCLYPGYYFQHLTKWLEYFDSRKIIIIDGLWFRHKPALVMNRLQLLLGVSEPLNYEKLLVYNEEKQFYCQRILSSHQNYRSSSDGETAKLKEGEEKVFVKCLGQSKGRKYEPMSEEARLFLNQHYWTHNRQLARLLTDIGQPLPTWMDEAMTFGNMRASVIY